MTNIESTINVYRELFNRESIPNQYWTLCKYQTDNKGNVSPTSELGQLTASGLIKQHQFHGVAKNKNVINRNKHFFPNSKWYHGNIRYAINQNFEYFNPSIINLKFNKMSKRSGYITSNILYLINQREIKNVLLIANVMVKNLRAGDVKSIDNIDDLCYSARDVFLRKTLVMEFRRGWKCYRDNVEYLYKGTGKNIIMSFMFYKKGGDL